MNLVRSLQEALGPLGPPLLLRSYFSHKGLGPLCPPVTPDAVMMGVLR